MEVPNVGAMLAGELRTAVADAVRALRDVDAARTRARPRPGAWSPREIIGHLIDSASNNHGRFVRGALGDALVFPTYDQEAWVSLHRYHDQEWSELLSRWSAFNEEIALAVERIPGAVLARERTEHNFDRIAWRTVPADLPVTLEYFIRDYIGHLRHHLAQVAASLAVTGGDRQA
jgi:hypothetical protein